MQKLANLEEAIAERLGDMPVSELDQFTATLRDEFAEFGVDITVPQQAELAFAGAFCLANAMFNEPVYSVRVAVFAAYVLRNLSTRAHGGIPVEDCDLPRLRSWRMRVMEWLSR